MPGDNFVLIASFVFVNWYNICFSSCLKGMKHLSNSGITLAMILQ